MQIDYYKSLRDYEKKLKSFVGLSNKNTSDFCYKADLLKNNVPLLLSQCHHDERQFLSRDLPYNTNLRDYLADKFGFCSILESYRLNDSYKHRILRIRKKILDIVVNYDNIFFITLTFTDETLDKTQKHIRRKYVQRWLKKYSFDYVGNIDYGEKNHREHYHALISTDRVDYKTWEYGAINFEKVRLDDKIDDKLAKYVNKFMYHAIKETTKREHLIYKRSVK